MRGAHAAYTVNAVTIHFFTKGDDKLPDSHQRAFGIARELNARGIHAVMHEPHAVQLSITPWPGKFSLIIATIRSLSSIRKGDIVFLQRAISNKYFFVIMATYLMLFRPVMIFDFDDAIYIYDPFKTKVFTRMASAVFVGSNTLAAWAKQYNDTVYVFHTPLKFSLYAAHTKDYSVVREPLVIGWVGTARHHRRNLPLLADVLKKLVEESSVPFRFVFVGVWGFPEIKALFEDIPGLQVEFVEYLEPQKLPAMIQSFDIGVMPLVGNDEWNRARSSFKPVEYMACGIATVSSSIGAITDIVKDGVNGYLARDENEWVEKLDLLLTDRGLRTRLGKSGQETVHERCCYEAVVPRMIEIFDSLETHHPRV